MFVVLAATLSLRILAVAALAPHNVLLTFFNPLIPTSLISLPPLYIVALTSGVTSTAAVVESVPEENTTTSVKMSETFTSVALLKRSGRKRDWLRG